MVLALSVGFLVPCAKNAVENLGPADQADEIDGFISFTADMRAAYQTLNARIGVALVS